MKSEWLKKTGESLKRRADSKLFETKPILKMQSTKKSYLSTQTSVATQKTTDSQNTLNPLVQKYREKRIAEAVKYDFESFASIKPTGNIPIKQSQLNFSVSFSEDEENKAEVKEKKNTINSTKAHTEDLEGGAAVRKRGRPKKIVTAESETTVDQVTSKSDTCSGGLIESDQTLENPVPRKRGRPRKTPLETEDQVLMTAHEEYNEEEKASSEMEL